MTWDLILTYSLACFAFVAVPGPSISLIVSNSLASGWRAGLWCVVGTQIGVSLLLVCLILGFSWAVAFVGEWFVWLKYLGAAYLLWLGLRLWFSSDEKFNIPQAFEHKGQWWYFTRQGLVVALSNPKILLFLSAFIPQFIDPMGDHTSQLVMLGCILMLCAIVVDSSYAFTAGRVGKISLLRYSGSMGKISGSVLCMGAVFLAFAKR